MTLAISAVFVIIAAANIGISVLVALQCPSNQRHRAFFVHAFGVACWIGGFGLLLLTHQPLFISVLNIGGLIALLGALLLAQGFAAAKYRIPHFYVAIVFIIAGGIAAYPGLLIESVTYTERAAIPVQGWIFPYYTAWFVITALWIAFLLRKAYKSSGGRERQQLQYFFFGIFTFVAIAILCNLVLPALGIFSLNFIGPAASCISIVTTGYAIARHHLLDIRIVIQRSITYIIVLICLLGGYAFVLAAASHVLHQKSELSSLLTGLLAIGAGIIGAPYIERFVKRLTNPLLFRDKPVFEDSAHNSGSVDELSHALQTPLTVLSSSLHALRKHPTDTSELVAGMETSVERMSQYIRSELQYSALSAVQMPEHPLDASKVVREIMEYVSITARDSGVALEVATEEHCNILIQRRHFEEMFTNILGNAIKYSSGISGASVSIQLRRIGDIVQLEVSDTGIGIAKSDLSEIFAKYRRACADTTRPGTGLGLHVVKRIVDSYNGTIGIESTVGAGTTVTVTFPAAP